MVWIVLAGQTVCLSICLTCLLPGWKRSFRFCAAAPKPTILDNTKRCHNNSTAAQILTLDCLSYLRFWPSWMFSSFRLFLLFGQCSSQLVKFGPNCIGFCFVRFYFFIWMKKEAFLSDDTLKFWQLYVVCLVFVAVVSFLVCLSVCRWVLFHATNV